MEDIYVTIPRCNFERVLETIDKKISYLDHKRRICSTRMEMCEQKYKHYSIFQKIKMTLFPWTDNNYQSYLYNSSQILSIESDICELKKCKQAFFKFECNSVSVPLEQYLLCDINMSIK